jgi:hypothetical protein
MFFTLISSSSYTRIEEELFMTEMSKNDHKEKRVNSIVLLLPHIVMLFALL